MNNAIDQKPFYFKMGVLLLLLVIAGFGSAMVAAQNSPFDFPLIFHVHAAVFIAWFLLFILQTKLVSHGNYELHKKLGYSSIALVLAMLITGLIMSAASFTRGVSPVPNTTIQQFMSFPLLDLTGLLIFVTLGILNRSNALVHKHCMLIASIAIMDPAIARLMMSIGIPQLIILLHIGLIGLVIVHDRRSAGKVHFITWCGLAFIVLRTAFIFTLAGTAGWASLINALYA